MLHYSYCKFVIPILHSMDVYEKGLIEGFFRFGDKFLSKLETWDKFSSTKDTEVYLIVLGQEFDVEGRALDMQYLIQKGFMLVDTIRGLDHYGKQIDYTIKKVLLKAFNKTKPRFKYNYDTIEGVKEREEWIIHVLLEKFWDGLSEEDKIALVREIEEDLKDADINSKKLLKMIKTGHASLTVIRQILGFKFHIFLAKLANAVVKVLLKRGLSLSANAMLQKFAAIVFGYFGWFLIVINLLNIVSSLLNPRRFDVFISCVFFIGVHRLNMSCKI